MTNRLYCPYTGTCDVAKIAPTGGVMRLDIIEQTPRGYECTVFQLVKGLEQKEIGEKCSHIEQLNLLSGLQRREQTQ